MNVNRNTDAAPKDSPCLNLPAFDAAVRERAGRREIFDFLRRRYVRLTPEEWVRQHFVHYLVSHRGYPQGLVQNEVELRVGEKRLRCDTVVYGRTMQPVMIVEYKAPSVVIDDRVFAQVSAYNSQLRVGWMVVSNGLSHFCCRVDYDKREYSFVTNIPAYSQL